MQAFFIAEGQVDHTLSKSRKIEGKLTHSEKALVDFENKLKQAIFHLAEVEKGCKNAKATLAGLEKQAEELRASLKNSETQLALAMEKTKQQQKLLKDKDAERAKAEQAAYDAGMTKTTQSLTAQLRDVACTFCVKVQSKAFNIARVEADSNLRGANKVYYPSALRLLQALPSSS